MTTGLEAPGALPPEAVKVAVVGCGYWGRNLVRNYHRLGALAAVADADADVASAQSALTGAPVLSFDEVLARPQITGVAIAAPAEQHAALALKALDAGKHVFVEKPLALTIEDAQRLIERAESTGRVLMVGHLLRYHPAFLRLQELIRTGTLGRLQYLYSNRLNLGKIRREENVFWSFAPHDLSMILALVGELPDTVQAIGLSYLHRVVADVTTTHLGFASGVNAHVFVSWLHPVKEQKLVVVGDAGMAVLDDGRPWAEKLTVYPHRITWLDGMPTPNKADGEPVRLDEAEPLELECRHFLDCMAVRRQPRTDGAEGLRVLRVLAAAEESMQRERIVTLPKANVRDQRPRATSRAGPAPDVVVHESSYVDEGCTIGPGTRIWHFSHVMAGSRIGRDCVIAQNVMVGPAVTVGDGCKIQNNVSLYKGVTLEDGVFCGPSCVFTNVATPRAEIERKDEFRETRVGRGATIGANATIVCGHEIGAYALVAAGAVVTRDVPPHALVAGVPARRIGWVSHAGERLGADLVCPRTGRRYRDHGGQLAEVTENEATMASHG